jgi:hypothetical protein
MMHGSIEGTGAKEKWTKRFFPKHQDFVKNASVTFDKEIPSEPWEEYKMFLEGAKTNIIMMAQSVEP